MNRCIVEHRIIPVIDCVFDFDSIADAYDHLRSGRHFGKVVVRIERAAVILRALDAPRSLA